MRQEKNDRFSGGGAAYLQPQRRRGMLPRVAARVGGVLVLALALLLGLKDGGYLDKLLRDVGGRSASIFGLAADRVEVVGLVRHSRQAVLAALGVHRGAALFGFSAARAKRLLENLDWVKRAEVQRRYPNGLRIIIEERTPIARWRVNGQTVLVDAEGVAMSVRDAAEYSHLPLVTGEGANAQAATLINHILAKPSLLSRLTQAEFVGNRRWNLHLRSGLVVLLPENAVGQALDRLVTLQRRYQLLDRAISRLDLRQPGRLALKRPPETPARGLE